MSTQAPLKDPEGLATRRAAHALMQGVMEEGRLLPELIGAGALDHLPPPARARAQRITLDTLRAVGRADSLLKPHLRKRPPLAVQNALRLGAVELASGEAAHGVVNAYVALMERDGRTRKFKGLVNAVLRQVAEPAVTRWNTLTLPLLPKWLRTPLAEAWGHKALAAMERVHAAGAPLDLTVKEDAAGWAKRLGGDVVPTGSVRLQKPGQVSALPGFADGAWWVQDAAAALPVKMLGDISGARALDLCAAPGGKTLQLAAGGATVTAVDSSAGRLNRVTENLARTGLTAQVQQADAFAVTDGGYDVIVLDAPCSATGTIRRHPDLPWAKDGSEFATLIDQQARMLDHALTLLAPGGRLLYCTCSLLPDEGEVQVEEALTRHPDLRVDTGARDLPGVELAWHSDEGGLRLRPDCWADRGGMDGFYMAVLHST